MTDINCIGLKSSWCHHTCNTDMYTICFKYMYSISHLYFIKNIFI